MNLTVNGEPAAYTAAEVSLEERVQIIAEYKPRFGRFIVGRYFAELPDHQITLLLHSYQYLGSQR